jgi:hypothetical protein
MPSAGALFFGDASQEFSKDGSSDFMAPVGFLDVHRLSVLQTYTTYTPMQAF